MEGRLLDKSLNPNKLLKEQFVSNLTGSSMLEIAALSTIVPALVVLRKWSSGDASVSEVKGIKGLLEKYIRVFAEWAYTCAISLVILIFFYIIFKRPQSHLKAGLSKLTSLRADVSSYRVSVVLVTCLCILAVDFKIFPRRYAKAETYGSGIVHVGEYGVHWNFFFTLAAVSILTSIVRIHPKHCGVVGLLILAGYQIWLSSGLNEYLISDKRGADIISQNKEGIYSIFGYWGMFLISVSLGYYLFVDNSLKVKNRNTQVVTVWVLAASFWILAIILDSCIERVSRRMVRY
nr:unnamed protein product [Digitaria exilis]